MNTHSIRKSVMLVAALAFVLLGVTMVFADESKPPYTPTPIYHRPSPSPTYSPTPTVTPTEKPTASPVQNPSVPPSPSSSVKGDTDPGPPWKWIGIAILVSLLLFLLFWILRRRHKPTAHTPPSQSGGGSYGQVEQQRPDQYSS